MMKQMISSSIFLSCIIFLINNERTYVSSKEVPTGDSPFKKICLGKREKLNPFSHDDVSVIPLK